MHRCGHDVADPHAKLLTIQLRTWLMANEHAQQETTYEHPAGWWQMFKRDCFPEWLLKWSPVKMATSVAIPNLTVHVCPHKALAPENGNHIEFVRLAGRQGYYNAETGER